MIPIPPQLTARLIMLGVTTLATTVIPFVVQDRPRLKWVWERFGPEVVSKVQQEVDQRFVPPATIYPNVRSTVSPSRYDNGVSVEGACIDCKASSIANPRDLCAPHWWSAGPVRSILSLPWRIGRTLHRWRWL